MASATVTSTTPKDDTGCPMVYLPTPINLVGGVEYMIVSKETSGGDQWVTDRYVTGLYKTSHATITGSTYGDSSDNMPPAYHNYGTDGAEGVPTFNVAQVTLNSCDSTSFNISSGPYNYKYDADSALTVTNLATNFLSQTFNGNRNDFSGRVGYSFVPTKNIQIDSLGRGTTQTATQNHIVEIWDTVTSSRVAYVTVTSSTPTDSIGCQMVSITPVTLTQGREYVIVSQEFNGGNMWLGDSSLSGKYHSELAAITGNTYATTAPGTMPTNYHGAGYDWVMGPGTFHVTSSTTTGNFMLVNKQGLNTTSLATGFAAGSSYNFLNAANIDDISVIDDTQCITVLIPGSCSWANYMITLYFFKQHPGLMRYKCDVSTTQSLKNPPSAGPDWRFYNQSTQQFINASISDYTGPYTGRYQWERRYDASCYFIENTAIQSLVFLKADLTSMNDYFVNGSSIPKCVTSAGTSGFGLSVKAATVTVPASRDYTLYDAYLYLDADVPTNNPDAMMTFVNHMGDCYKYMQQPLSEYTDWPALVPQMLTDVNNNPENWSNPWNGTYVMPLSYVGTAKTDWEIGAMSSLLIPLMSYESQRGPISNQQPLMNRLKALAPAFYQSNWANTGQGLIWNNPPSSLAISATVDPWYYTWATEVMGSMAMAGLADAQTAVFGARQHYIGLAEDINYEYDYYTSIYNRTTTGEPEPDCTGSFLYHMMQLYSLTSDPTLKQEFLNQAEAAAPYVAARGLDYAYEVSTTATGFAGLMWLYDETNDANYLNYAYIPLANVIFHSWMFENDCGYTAYYRTFWRTSATPGNQASASFEDADVYRFLYEGYMKAPNALSKQAQSLITEFFKWNKIAAKYSLPPYLPANIIDTDPDCGDNNLNYFIPLEDLWGDGAHLLGQTGQEIYGMNILWYAVLPYKVFSSNNVEVYSDYPIISCDWNQEPDTIRIHIGGASDFNPNIRVKYTAAMNWVPSGVQVYKTDSNFSNAAIIPVSSVTNLISFNTQGGGYYKIKGK